MATANELAKALKTVKHSKLLTAVFATTISHNTIRWHLAHLRGHHTSSRYNETTSTCHARRVFLQGQVISSTLLKYLFSSTQKIQSSIDDSHIALSAARTQMVTDALTVNVRAVRYSADEKEQQLPNRFNSSELFTLDTHQLQNDPFITLGNSLLSLEYNAKILSGTNVTKSFFSQHVNWDKRNSGTLRVPQSLGSGKHEKKNHHND